MRLINSIMSISIDSRKVPFVFRSFLILSVFLISSFGLNASDTQTVVLYPSEAYVTKGSQTVKIPDLTGLPSLLASYNRNTDKVVVLNGSNKLLLSPYGHNYFGSGKKGSLSYNMQAFINNGKVTKVSYKEIQDNIKVEIIYKSR